MRRAQCSTRGMFRLLTKGLAATLCVALIFGPLLPVRPALAGPGEIILNGTATQPDYIRADSVAAAGVPQNFFVAPGFLFEPESPYDSLKSVPTWAEIEQLLDNPYAVARDPITPGTFEIPPFPSYRSTITRRPSFLPTPTNPAPTLLDPGAPLPQFLVHGLNYNPTTGEEMRLLNSRYIGGRFKIPDQLYLDLARDPTGNTWNWTFKTVTVSPGAGRVTDAEIDYNGPVGADPFTCVSNLELVPPEGTILCGRDPGEPGYAGFGVFNPVTLFTGYSTPAVPTSLLAPGNPSTPLPSFARLFDPTRGFILARNPATGAGGLRKPSLRVPPIGSPSNPGYLVNTDPNNTTPSNENDYYRPDGAAVTIPARGSVLSFTIPTGRNTAIALGKAFFWDMQVGSDGVQSCGTCHFTGQGTDTRTKNQLNPNHLGGDFTLQIGNTPSSTQPGSMAANYDLKLSDFPFRKVANPDVSGDPACTTPLVATVDGGVLENTPNGATGATGTAVTGVTMTVCDAANVVRSVNDVASSMGVRFGTFKDIRAPGPSAFGPASEGVRPLLPDLRGSGIDPIPVFQGFRRVEPRNTPTMQAAGFNFDNFWDGRARHDFNGGSVFGAADPQKHVWVTNGLGTASLTATRQLIKFASIASLATGPALSEFEMSFAGRNWQKIGKKLLQAGVTPLANQLVDPNDSVLGPFSGQRSVYNGAVNRPGQPGLNVTYEDLIKASFFRQLWNNTTQHLNGCDTDGNAALHPNQCSAVGVTVEIPVLLNGVVTDSATDPFDNFALYGPFAGPASATNTNQFRQIEANFPLFWGLSVHAWVQILVPDNTPFDQFLEANPEAFLSLGDTSEKLLVNDLVNCTSATQRNCFREVGNFKRDSNAVAFINATGEGGTGATAVPAGGTRTPGSNQSDPLLGADIFFASNLSLKNPNFRSGRCGACHNMPTLTDHTVPFTFKWQLPDFSSEFTPLNPGVELLVEPLGRGRLISGFLLESETAENGQDAIERRFVNQSIVPCPTNGIAYPGGTDPVVATAVPSPTPGAGFGVCAGAAQAFIDNGVYNIGVRPINEDVGRGGPDAFGWPLSLATLMLKNLGGREFEAGTPMMTFDPALGPEGGLFEESAQDQQINPGATDEPVNPLLPAYLAPFVNGIPVGDAQPELDEPHAGINTLTDVAMLEGFVDVIGPVSPSAVKNEALNMSKTQLMGTWPVVNRVLRDGAFKAPQLRDVELTAPYFHNGGVLTLRQVVDFYARGGDFPISNAAHRDFLLVNLNIEAQSNLTEEEKVAMVDFLLELTDDRVRFARSPFDHPQVIVPLDGTAPDNTDGRAALLALTTGDCGGAPGVGPCFKDVPAVGAAGEATPQVGFLGRTGPGVGVAGRNPGLNGQPIQRLSGAAAVCTPVATSQYCR
jgi:cytochrome c peroxidase